MSNKLYMQHTKTCNTRASTVSAVSSIPNRKIHENGNCDQDFEKLTSYKDRNFTFVAGSEMLSQILGLSPLESLDYIGKDFEWLKA